MSRQSRGGNRGHRRGSRRDFAGPPRPRPQGFRRSGIDAFFQILLPGFQGPDKREFYNEIARGAVGLSGILGLILGTLVAGPVGGFFGLGLGVILASKTAREQRFHRRGRP